MVDMTTGFTRLIVDACRRQGLLRNQTAYVLATARWETAHTMKPVKEAYWLSETWRKNNLRYYPWYGRGFVQLTWEANYKLAAKKIGAPIDRKPDLALDPEIAAHILVVGMKSGWFTGRKIADYITLQTSDFTGARRIVNGTDKAAKIAALAKEYNAALKAEGYGEAPKPSQPTAPKPITPKSGHGLLAAITASIASFLKGLFGAKK